MANQYFQKVPFTIKLAKQVESGEKKGEIVTRDGKQARILSYGLKNEIYPIVAAVKQNENVGENAEVYTTDGKWDDEGESPNDLFIRVPTYYKDYSNFKPQFLQACIVRNSESEPWDIKICTSKRGEPFFYDGYDEAGLFLALRYKFYLPVTRVTQRLVGKVRPYEELVKELDNKWDKAQR